jgi:1-deoxyxylulose-5-phosphate synthase
MNFGPETDEPTSFAIMDKAHELGINFFDSANVYGRSKGRGATEEIVGRWFAQCDGRRDRTVLATKLYGDMGEWPNEGRLSALNIRRACDASLRRLQTDYIDLYQLHGYDPATPIEETLGALDDLVQQGKVRYIGCSNFLTYQLVRAIGKSETNGLARFDSVQPRYNLLFRQIEREMLPFCGEDGVGVIPYNPLAGGLLSGKHNRSDAPPSGSRFTLGTAARNYQERYWHDREFDTVEQLLPLAEAAGVSLVTLAVAWVLDNPAITAPIIGASRADQLDANLAATSFVIDDALRQQLDEITHEYRMGDAPR